MSRFCTLLSALVIAAGLVSVTYSTAQACSCIGPSTPQAALDHADAAFFGEVSQIESEDRHYRVYFEVELHWKGIDGERVEIRTHQQSATCGYSFDVGRKYLVYASRDDDGLLRVSLCSGTTEADRQKALSDLGEPDHSQHDDVDESDQSQQDDVDDSDHSQHDDVDGPDHSQQDDVAEPGESAQSDEPAAPSWTATVDPLTTVLGFVHLQIERRLSSNWSLYAGPHLRLFDSVFESDSQPFRGYGAEVGLRYFPTGSAIDGPWLGIRAVGARLSTYPPADDATGFGGYTSALAGYTWRPVDWFVLSGGAGIQYIDYRVDELGPRGVLPAFHTALGVAF